MVRAIKNSGVPGGALPPSGQGEPAQSNWLGAAVDGSGSSTVSARQRLADFARANGIPGVIPDRIRAEQFDQLEAEVIRALLLREVPNEMIREGLAEFRSLARASGVQIDEREEGMLESVRLDDRKLIQERVFGVRHGSVLDLGKVFHLWIDQVDRVSEVLRVYEAAAMHVGRQQRGLLQSLQSAPDSGSETETLQREFREKSSELTRICMEAIKKASEAASEFTNVVLKERVSATPFNLSEQYQARLETIGGIIGQPASLLPYARGDVDTAHEVLAVLKDRLRQVSQSGAYNDDKGPFYYWKLGAAHLYKLMIPRAAVMPPDCELRGLFWDPDARVRVAAAQAAKHIERSIGTLLDASADAAPSHRMHHHLGNLLLVRNSLKRLVVERLEGAGKSGAPALHRDERAILAETYRRPLSRAA